MARQKGWQNGITFTDPMGLGVLAELKSQTRRLLRPQPDLLREYGGKLPEGHVMCPTGDSDRGLGMRDPILLQCPYGEPGALLRARESCWIDKRDLREVGSRRAFFAGCRDVVWENGQRGQSPFESSALLLALNGSLEYHAPPQMPGWASRFSIRITSVRVERVQDISEADAVAEASAWAMMKTEIDSPVALDKWCDWSVRVARDRKLPRPATATPLGAFAMRWERRYSERGLGWYGNPWVWVLGFELMKSNVALTN